MTKPPSPPPAAAKGWQNRIIGHGTEAPDQLLANPKNWRVHPGNQQAGMEAVLDRVGWVQSVVVNQRSGFLVDGHLRVSLALRRNEPKIPVVYVDLDDEEEDLILATLDPIAALAGTDQDLLESLLSGIVTEDPALTALLGKLSGDYSGDGKGPGDDGEPGKDGYKEQYGVIVICENSAHQEKIYNELQGAGHNCRVVVT